MSDVDVLEALAKVTRGHADRAGDADLVAGVWASFVAVPGSTDEVADVLRVAAEHELAVCARGSGSKLDWGMAPGRVDLIVDTRRLDRVVEHAAGDLVVVVQAGVPLARLADTLATAGQQLAIDETVPGATVGGAVATGASGPRRLLYGGVRDLIIGSTLVRADGVVAKSGGKVVKNVAGYDLSKLGCGSYGTLGIVTQAAFRLHPAPPARSFVSLPTADAAAAHAAVQRVFHGQVVPTAIELDQPAGRPEAAVTVLVEGMTEGVAARARQAAELLGSASTVDYDPPAGWGLYPAGPGDVLIKLTAAVGHLRRLLEAVSRAAARADVPVAVRGSAGAGVLYAAVPARGAVGPAATGAAGPPAGGGPRADTVVDVGAVARLVAALRRDAPTWSGSVVVLDAPAAVRAALDMWGPVPGLELMRRIKDEFDPGHRLAPGRFVGGI